MTFETRLAQCPYPQRDALIQVTDTMELVKLWFEDRKIPYRGADIVSATELVLADLATRPLA